MDLWIILPSFNYTNLPKMDTWLKKKKKQKTKTISTKKLGTEYNLNKESTSEQQENGSVHAALIITARTRMQPRVDAH